MTLTITLNNQDKEEIFYNSMCNGLHQTRYWGIELDFDEKEYDIAKKSLQDKGSNTWSYEQVFMEMLRMGYSIQFIDIECEGEYSRTLTMDMIHRNMDKVPQKFLLNIYNEQDDLWDADAVLQSVLFEELIFG